MRLLLVFIKEPIAGKVKTRLANSVGTEEAARFYKAMVEVLLIQLRGLENCRIRFCYAPDDADDAIRFWLLPEMGAISGERDGVYLAPTYNNQQPAHQEIDFKPQGNGDLGDRLHKAFEDGFSDGFKSIAVIGSDCPECGARWINAAFSRLEASSDRDLVIGPSPDGGYYLLAMQSVAPTLFTNIPWSSDQVYSTTLEKAESNQLKTESLLPLRDIDTNEDWEHLLASPLGAAVKKALGEHPEPDDLISFDE